MKPSSICIFCGSKEGVDPAFAEAASLLGTLIASKKIDLIYGGGNAGIMGHCSRAALAAGGNVTGIIPKKIFDMVEHVDLTELHVVESMHDRKAKMHQLADAFIVLPGGIGTMEEFFEAFTWRQLEYHDKPIALLNTSGYFDALTAFLVHMTGAGFLDTEMLAKLIVEKEPERIINMLSE